MRNYAVCVERDINMLKSMTGFGRAENLIDGFLIKVQVKSVNHRYGDFSIRVPRLYNFIEEKVRQRLFSYISRGKVEVNISVEQKEGDDRQITLNKELAKSYLNALRELEDLGLGCDIRVSHMSRFSDIFDVSYNEIDEEEIFEKINTVLTAALDEFVKMRSEEGKRLEDDIKSHISAILEYVEFIEKRSPETSKEYRARLEARIKEVLADRTIDESRIITEAAIFADKVAVDEETVRLRSHIKEFLKTLSSDKPIGKKLDFIVQEMNRETNTIGSKASDVEICSTVVEIKSEIEKIREQIQNIE